MWGYFMKSHKTITIDTALALELQKRKGAINVSEVCQNALMVACEMQKPKTAQDVRAQLLKIETERAELLKLLEKEKAKEMVYTEKTKKEEFRKELLLLKKIKINNPNMFVPARQQMEKKYNLTNAEIIKELEKV